MNRLVLIGSGTTVRTAATIEFNEAVKQLTDPLPPAFAREFQESAIFKPVPPDFLATMVRESEKLPARVWRDVLAGLLAPDALRPAARIQATTLILWGDKDAFWNKSEQEGLVSAIAVLV